MNSRFFHWLWRVSVVVLIAGIGAGAFFWLSQSSLLAVEDIQVDGNLIIPSDKILEKAEPVLHGRSLLSFSFDDVGRILSQFPFTDSVEVERVFPHTIRLHIRERRPLVWLKTGEQYLLVSTEGKVLEQQPAPNPSYPLLTTKDACTADLGQQLECSDVRDGVQFLANIPVNFNQEVTDVSVADDDINAKTRSNAAIHFGTLDNYNLKFEVLRQLIARATASGETVSIDVSVPDRPVTR